MALNSFFCRHKYEYLGFFKVFTQSPFHPPHIGWMYYCNVFCCSKCGKKDHRNIKWV